MEARWGSVSKQVTKWLGFLPVRMFSESVSCISSAGAFKMPLISRWVLPPQTIDGLWPSVPHKANAIFSGVEGGTLIPSVLFPTHPCFSS